MTISKRIRSEACKQQQKEYYKQNKDKFRNRRLLAQFGLSLSDYDRMLAKQGYRCAICGIDTPGGRGKFHVDHSHVTGEVRSLLCHACNIGLGCFKDNPELLQKAKNYLLAWI